MTQQVRRHPAARQLPTAAEETEITAIARSMYDGKSPSILHLSRSVDMSEIKKQVHLRITKFLVSSSLPLEAIEVRMIVDWICSTYNPETGEGGAMGYSLDDIDLIFRMGITGRFGKPTGHKYVLPEITGRNGWFDQYHALRQVEMGAYHHRRNRRLIEAPPELTGKEVPCPPEYSMTHEKMQQMLSKKATPKYKSLEEYADSIEVSFVDFISPFIAECTAEYQKIMQPFSNRPVTLEAYIQSKKENLLFNINKNS